MTYTVFVRSMVDIPRMYVVIRTVTCTLQLCRDAPTLRVYSAYSILTGLLAISLQCVFGVCAQIGNRSR